MPLEHYPLRDTMLCSEARAIASVSDMFLVVSIWHLPIIGLVHTVECRIVRIRIHELLEHFHAESVELIVVMHSCFTLFWCGISVMIARHTAVWQARNYLHKADIVKTF